MKLKIETADTSALLPYAHNAKEHPDWQIAQIVKSIEQFGFNDPVGVWTNENGQLEIVEGHGRVLAAKELGLDSVPIVKLDHLDDEGRRAYTHIHNRINENTGADWETLKAEFDAMPEIEWRDYFTKGDWFGERDEKSGHQDGNDDYNDWLDKFEVKKTTDDCYTPENIYEVIASWVAKTYKRDRSNFVRPFYPGGDYEREIYPQGCTVVDNPPFSILAKIARFYCEHDIAFFIFAPTLTLFSSRGLDVCYIPADADITYDNGAVVNTSFITNLDKKFRVRTAPDLTEAVKKADAENKEMQPILLKYDYPTHVITAAKVSNWSAYGVDFRVPKGSCVRISELDVQKKHDKAIFGGGFLLSAAQAAKAAGVDEADIDEDGSIVWKLSDREREIIAGLK